MAATLTAERASGAAGVQPENRVRGFSPLSWPRLGVDVPLSPERVGDFPLHLRQIASAKPYGYVGGDPLNSRDPTGMNPRDWEGGNLGFGDHASEYLDKYGSSSWAYDTVTDYTEVYVQRDGNFAYVKQTGYNSYDQVVVNPSKGLAVTVHRGYKGSDLQELASKYAWEGFVEPPIEPAFLPSGGSGAGKGPDGAGGGASGPGEGFPPEFLGHHGPMEESAQRSWQGHECR